MKSAERMATPYAWYVAAVLMIAHIFGYMDRMVITLLIPGLKQDLALSDTAIALVQGLAFAVFFALAGLPLGRLVDRTNRRNLLLIGVTLWSGATASCAFASSFGELFIARIGVGVGEACLAPAAVSLIADYFPSSQRGRAIGLVVAGMSVGTALSYYGGGAILTIFSGGADNIPLLGEARPWQMVFLIFGVAGLVVPLLLLSVREPNRREVMKTANVSDSRFLGTLWTARGVIVPLFAAVACNNLTSYALVVWGPVILMRDHGISPADLGFIIGTMMIATGPTGAAVGGLLSDMLIRRYPLNGRLRLVWLIFPFYILAIASLGWKASAPVTIAILTACSFLSNVFNSPNYTVVADLMPNKMRGQVIAVYTLIANLAGAGLGATMVALVTDYFFRDPSQVRYSILLVSLPSAAMVVLLGTIAMRPYAKRRASLLN